MRIEPMSPALREHAIAAQRESARYYTQARWEFDRRAYMLAAYYQHKAAYYGVLSRRYYGGDDQYSGRLKKATILQQHLRPLWYHDAKHARDDARRIMARRFPAPRLDVITDSRSGMARTYIIVLSDGRDGRACFAGYLAEDLVTVLPADAADCER